MNEKQVLHIHSPLVFNGELNLSPEKWRSIYNSKGPVFNSFVRVIYYGINNGEFCVWHKDVKGTCFKCENKEIIDLFSQHYFGGKKLKVIPYAPGIVLIYTDHQIWGTLDFCHFALLKTTDRTIDYITYEYEKGNILKPSYLYYEDYESGYFTNVTIDFSTEIVRMGMYISREPSLTPCYYE